MGGTTGSTVSMPQQQPQPQPAGGKGPSQAPQQAPQYQAGDTFNSGRTAEQYQQNLNQLAQQGMPQSPRPAAGKGASPAPQQSQAAYPTYGQQANPMGQLAQQGMQQQMGYPQYGQQQAQPFNHFNMQRGTPSQIARQQALAAQAAGQPLSQAQQIANLQAAMTGAQQAQQGMNVAPQASSGQAIPQSVLDNYNAQMAGQQSQAVPFQTQQFLSNIAGGTGALGQMGQQGYPQPGAQIMGGTVTPQTYTGQQGYPQPGARIMGGTVTPQTYTGQQSYPQPPQEQTQMFRRRKTPIYD